MCRGTSVLNSVMCHLFIVHGSSGGKALASCQKGHGFDPSWCQNLFRPFLVPGLWTRHLCGGKKTLSPLTFSVSCKFWFLFFVVYDWFWRMSGFCVLLVTVVLTLLPHNFLLLFCHSFLFFCFIYIYFLRPVTPAWHLFLSALWWMCLLVAVRRVDTSASNGLTLWLQRYRHPKG